ncbi:MAG: TauD/TfdA family dioxygenase [SAR86 cluster bacterium]|uniref:TauD/TfdA family dioxygenase n=1 Tax=SAR86 cluster bacterium TaxID=2030880 RepID=A0A937LGT1_9GAMM|nr:TauD/TfdA family dioxygenase [SAR86 cluster bacterium]|tara:strand:- start:4961 stop:5794 length:834 start_codon:yes stop_codon:yes gene_type:complete
MRVNENLSKNGIGVEVSEFSLSDLTAENVAFLRSKWVEYGLIVFPKLPLSHDEFKDFALSFGNFGDDPFISSLPDYPNIAEIKRSANEKATPFGGTWHSDWSFMKKPPSATLLHSKIIPPVGGNTLFANTERSFAALSDGMKNKLRNLKVIHSAKIPYADDGFYALEKEERSMKILPSKEAKATFSHPMIKIHPETKKECLFINPVYTINIEGFSENESQELLWELYEHMIQDKFVYEHVWKEDMLIMWDNRTVMHQASGGYDGYERLLHRITLAAV